MTEKGVGAAVVIDEEQPGPGDRLRARHPSVVGAGEDPDTELVRDHMSDTVISAAPDWSLERAAMEMSRRHIRHLVIVDGGDIAGSPLDARHHARLDDRGRDLGDDLAGGRSRT